MPANAVKKRGRNGKGVTMTFKKIIISGKYGGGAKVEAISTEGEKFVIEPEHAEEVLLDIFNKLGEVAERKPRQQYQRLIIKL